MTTTDIAPTPSYRLRPWMYAALSVLAVVLTLFIGNLELEGFVGGRQAVEAPILGRRDYVIKSWRCAALLWHPEVFERFSRQRAHGTKTGFDAGPLSPTYLPDWARDLPMIRDGISDDRDTECLYAVAVGWPYRCLRGSVETIPVVVGTPVPPVTNLSIQGDGRDVWLQQAPDSFFPSVNIKTALFATPRGASPGMKTLIPYGIVRRALVVNFLFYFVLIGSLHVVVCAAIRLYRFRRSCCPNCGYDSTHVPSGICSECGVVLVPSPWRVLMPHPFSSRALRPFLFGTLFGAVVTTVVFLLWFHGASPIEHDQVRPRLAREGSSLPAHEGQTRSPESSESLGGSPGLSTAPESNDQANVGGVYYRWRDYQAELPKTSASDPIAGSESSKTENVLDSSDKWKTLRFPPRRRAEDIARAIIVKRDDSGKPLSAEAKFILGLTGYELRALTTAIREGDDPRDPPASVQISIYNSQQDSLGLLGFEADGTHIQPSIQLKTGEMAVYNLATQDLVVIVGASQVSGSVDNCAFICGPADILALRDLASLLKNE